MTALSGDIDLARTVFIVSSKSGTTLETQSFLDYFWNEATHGGSTAGRFVAVTDEGSPLEELARERGFLRVFTAPSDVGGRYSALTEFGLVPAAAIGAPLDQLGASAREAVAACGPQAPSADNPALVLGALLGEGVLAGLDKATFVASPSLQPLVPWIEQLVAESTGKDRTGIVPVGGDDASVANSRDRTFIVLESVSERLDAEYRTLAGAGRPVARVTIDGASGLGGLMFVLEFAVAAAGAVLGIQPFDQPDVQLAKELAAKAMDGESDGSAAPAVPVSDPDLVPRLGEWLEGLSAPGYGAILAFLPSNPTTRAALEIARRALRDHRNVVATADFGPRFLHSTGQLHKGGPRNGHFLQVVDDPNAGLQVPGTDYTFDRLIRAQAVGDYHALVDRGQRVLRIDLGDTGPAGLETLMTAVVTAARG